MAYVCGEYVVESQAFLCVMQFVCKHFFLCQRI